MQFTESGRRAVAHPNFAKVLRQINDVDQVFIYTCLVACSDDDGKLIAGDAEILAFLNSQIDDLRSLICASLGWLQ